MGLDDAESCAAQTAPGSKAAAGRERSKVRLFMVEILAEAVMQGLSDEEAREELLKRKHFCLGERIKFT